MKILFITGGTPWPTTIGVNQRTHLLHRALSECGEVDTIINSPYVKFSEEEKIFMQDKFGLLYLLNPLHLRLKNDFSNGNLINFCVKKREDWFGSYLTNKENEKIVNHTILKNKYNLVVSRYLRSSINTGSLKYTPNVLDVDDLNMEVIKNAYTKKKNHKAKKYLWPIYSQLIKMIEVNYLHKHDYLWLSKEIDQKIVNHTKSCVLPNIPFYGFCRNDVIHEEQESDCIALFVGSMKHVINVEGIDRFIRIVWPNIKKQKPDAVLRVVGSGMTEGQKANWNRFDGVQAVGFAENIDSEYAKCAFSIIPLAEGGGTKIKLIESLLHGRTCVTDIHSFKGYENVLKNGEDVYVTDSDDMFISKCIKLYNDPTGRKEMARNGKEKVDQHFNYSKFKHIVQKTIAQVGDGTKYIRVKYR